MFIPLTFKALVLGESGLKGLLAESEDFFQKASVRQTDDNSGHGSVSIYRYKSEIVEREIHFELWVPPDGPLPPFKEAQLYQGVSAILYSFNVSDRSSLELVKQLLKKEKEHACTDGARALLPFTQPDQDIDESVVENSKKFATEHTMTVAVVSDVEKIGKILSKLARFLKHEHEKRVEATRPQPSEIHKIIKNGDLQQLEFCLYGDLIPKHSTPGPAIQFKDKRGMSPLHTAVELGDQAIVDYLLDAGCDLNSRDNTQRTALHIAAAQGYSGVAFSLISRGINTSLREKSQLTYAGVAAREGNLSFLQTAIERWNADPTEIKELDLTGRQLKDLPDFAWEKLTNLRVLDLSGNNLDVVPIELTRLAQLEKVSLEGNPLRSIPERFREPWSVLHSYLHSVGNKSARWTEKKVLFVGQEGVGKTTLLKAIRSRRHKVSCKDNLSTDGIDIHKNIRFEADKPNGSPVSFTAWDFGGQEVFYPSHQFFLASNSIFMVVFNIADEDLSRVDYWMKQIALMNNSKESPIILVGTHADDKRCTVEYLEERMKILDRRYPDYRYLGLKGMLSVSCKSGQGIKKLIDTIIKIINGGVHYLVPQSWIHFHQYLTSHTRTTNYVRWSVYTGWARRFGVALQDMKPCTNFLSDVGSLIYFDDPQGSLDDLVILNPQFLADLMSTLVTFRHSWVKQGKLAFSDLPQVLHRFDATLVDSLLALLIRFRIIHHVKGSSDYMVPSLLPPTPPRHEIKVAWPAEVGNSLREYRRVYKFTFLPLGFFSRLMLRILHIPEMKGELYWLEGFVVQYERQTAQVSYCSRAFKLTMEVRVKPDDPFPGLLLRILMEAVESLISGFYPKLKTQSERLVPCTHCIKSYKSLREPYYFTYAECVSAIVRGQAYVFCQNIPSASRCVRIEELAPDIGFADIPLLSNDDITIDSQLGAGGFGVVYKGMYKDEAVAIKELKFLLGNDEERVQKFREFQQEAWIMSIIDYPHLVRMIGCSVNPLRMTLELVTGGDLFAFIHPKVEGEDGGKVMQTKQQEEFDWNLRLRFAFDIALGMRHLHHEVEPPIIHRDLRSPNIFLVSADPEAPVCAKIADFGLATVVLPDVAGSLGTWQWLAPEVIDRLGASYDIRSDVYSFGVVMWELCAMKIPFLEYLKEEAFTRIGWDKSGKEARHFEPDAMKLAIIEKNLRPTIPSNLPSGWSELISQCFSADPQDRPYFTEIVDRLAKMSEGKLTVPRLSTTTKGLNAHRPTPRSIPGIVLPSFQNTELVKSAQQIEFDFKIRCLVVQSNTAIWLTGADLLVRYDLAKSEKSLHRLQCNTQRPLPRHVHSMILVDQILWCGCEDGAIFLWDTNKNKELAQWEAHPRCVVKQMVVVHTPTGKSVWTASPVERCIQVWDTEAPYRKIATIHSPDHTVNCLAQHQDNVWVGGNGDLNVYNSSTHQFRGTWRAHDSSVTAIISLGNRVWTGSAAGEIRIWEDASELQILLIKELDVHCAKILGLCKYQTQHVWSSALDKSILIWDIKKLSPLQEIIESKDSMSLLLRDGSQILGASDKTVYVWRYLKTNDQENAPSEEEESKGRYSPRNPRTVLPVVRIGERALSSERAEPARPRRRTFIGSSRDANLSSP